MKIGKCIRDNLGARLVLISCLSVHSTSGSTMSIMPPQLFGKSIVVSWSEVRMRRTAGEEQFHSQNVSLTESIYISTAGHFFNRRTYHRSGVEREYAGTEGVSAKSAAPDAPKVQFQGRSLIMTSTRISGARRVEIDFDGNFASCTARVVNGKAAGATAYTVHSLTDPATPVEIQSASSGAASCSVKDGNILAN
jgi:hypothetical protein